MAEEGSRRQVSSRLTDESRLRKENSLIPYLFILQSLAWIPGEYIVPTSGRDAKASVSLRKPFTLSGHDRSHPFGCPLQVLGTRSDSAWPSARLLLRSSANRANDGSQARSFTILAILAWTLDTIKPPIGCSLLTPPESSRLNNGFMSDHGESGSRR